VRAEKNGDVTTIILSRVAHKNAVDGPTAVALAQAFTTFEQDDTSKVAVLWGEHGTFCAGADLKAVASQDSNKMNPLNEDGIAPMGVSHMMLKKPVIAAISGYAVAGGLELACWCDLRVMEEDAVVGVFCRRWGVPLIDGGTIRLTRLIGQSRALDLILTGRPVSAQEALFMGLANRVVGKNKAREEAERLAHQIAAFPQICMNGDRISVYEQWDLSMKDALRNEFRHGLEALAHGESVQGATQFVKGKGRHGSFTDNTPPNAKL